MSNFRTDNELIKIGTFIETQPVPEAFRGNTIYFDNTSGIYHVVNHLTNQRSTCNEEHYQQFIQAGLVIISQQENSGISFDTSIHPEQSERDQALEEAFNESNLDDEEDKITGFASDVSDEEWANIYDTVGEIRQHCSDYSASTMSINTVDGRTNQSQQPIIVPDEYFETDTSKDIPE